MAELSDPIAHSTLVGVVHERLQTLICSGELPPGEKLVIDRIAAQMGVSITPVREALRWLERDGLVAHTSYQGMSVTKASTERLRELFEIRGVLEGYAMAQATSVLTDEGLAVSQRLLEAMDSAIESNDGAAFRRINLEFHTNMLEQATSEVLKSEIASLTRDLERYRRPNVKSDIEYMESAQRQHREMLRLVRNRKVKGIEKLTREHALLFVDHSIGHPKGAS